MSNRSQVELMKWMLQDIRKVTLEGIKGLTKEQLFEPPIEGEYSIGAYLMHFAECEIYWYEQFSGDTVSDELKKRAYSNVWFDPGGEANPPTSPPEVQEYLSVLDEIRNIVMNGMDKLTDEDLETEVDFKVREGEMRFSKKWILYHLIEHEAHHRGQMFMLIRMGKLK